MRFGSNAVVGLAMDIFDWMLIGMIPGFGDIADLIATFYWTKKLGALGLIEALELVPAADVLPINTALGMVADAKVTAGGAHA